MKAAVKQPPIIDPSTGLEFVVDNNDDNDEISKGSESVNSEDSDADPEFFEATVIVSRLRLGSRFLAGVRRPSLI